MNKAEVAENKNTDTLRKKIEAKVAEIAAIADELPGVFIIHHLHDLSVIYMSASGKELLGVNAEELIKMGPDYHKTFFNEEESKEYVPKIIGLLERNINNEVISFFQQVRFLGKQDYTWHLSSLKILLWDDAGKPVLILTIALCVDPHHHITTKVGRLLEENNFLRNNYHQFAKLSKREKEILKLLALGKSSVEISAYLFISVATVETHRRNIRQKLKINSFYELSQYARAFDLI